MADQSKSSWLNIFMNLAPSSPPAKSPRVFQDSAAGQDDKQDWLSRIFLNPEPVFDTDLPPCCIRPNNGSVFWGLRDLPVEAAGRHMLIIGAPGSGKTLSIELFLQSLAHRLRGPVQGGAPERLIILDVKGTFYSFLTAQGVAPDDIQILDPFDPASVPWNIARDVCSDAGADRLAALIVPAEEKANVTYFWQAARAVVRSVIIALNTLLPKTWTLRDLLNALSTPKHIERLLARVPRARIKADPYIKDTIHFPSTFTTIATKAFRLETVAALWHHSKSPRPFSISDWFSNDPSRQRHGVLLLGHRPKYGESITPINGLLLRMIADELQSWPDVTRPHTWIVLDEFRWMKEVDCMAELLGVGRSKGAAILLGLQDVSGLRHVYGNDRAEEILGLCENKTFLRLGNPATAEWVSKYFGDREATEIETSISRGKETTTTESKKIVTRPLFLNAEFTNLEAPEDQPGKRFCGIHHLPSLGDPYFTDEDAQVIYAMNRKPSAEHLAAHGSRGDRPSDHETYLPWEPAEEEAVLGHPPQEPNTGEPSGKATRRSRQSGQEPAGPNTQGDGPNRQASETLRDFINRKLNP